MDPETSEDIRLAGTGTVPEHGSWLLTKIIFLMFFASTNIQKKVVRWQYLIRAWLMHQGNTYSNEVCPLSNQLWDKRFWDFLFLTKYFHLTYCRDYPGYRLKDETEKEPNVYLVSQTSEFSKKNTTEVIAKTSKLSWLVSKWLLTDDGRNRVTAVRNILLFILYYSRLS